MKSWISDPFIKIWLLSLAAKITLGIFFPIFLDETYYWVWSHNLQLSYYDHPPFVSWLYFLGQPFESLGNGIRIPGIVFGHLSLLIWREILKPFFNEKDILLWLFICLLNPITGIAAIVITPDTPLMFFWSLATFFVLRAIDSQKIEDYIGVGVALGFGFLSKYTIAIFLLALIPWLLFSNDRKKIVGKYFVLSILIGLLICLPVFIWNYQNNFDSIRFQINHGLGSSRSLRWVGPYILGQILLIFPVFLFLALKTTIKSKITKLSWVKYWAWAPILFFGLSSTKGRVEANWTVVAFPALFILVVMSKEKKKWILGSLGIIFSLHLVLFTHLIHPWFPFKTKFQELHAFEEIAENIDKYRPFYASTFQMASKLSYITKTPIYKIRGYSRKDFYDYLEESIPKENVFFLPTLFRPRIPKWVYENFDIETTIQLKSGYEIIKFSRKSK